MMVVVFHWIQSDTRRRHDKSNSALTVFLRSLLVELGCPYRDVGEAVPVGSLLRPIRTAPKNSGRLHPRTAIMADHGAGATSS
jgi:hypothetical protein